MYWAKVNAVLGDDELDRLRKGIEIGPGMVTLPCRVRGLRKSEKYSWLEITLTEGKNRQIRRMIEALGHTVIKLVRVQIGSLRLGELGVGKWRELTLAEVRQLRGIEARERQERRR
jgi:pseudouridine synthase